MGEHKLPRKPPLGTVGNPAPLTARIDISWENDLLGADGPVAETEDGQRIPLADLLRGDEEDQPA